MAITQHRIRLLLEECERFNAALDTMRKDIKGVLGNPAMADAAKLVHVRFHLDADVPQPTYMIIERERYNASHAKNERYRKKQQSRRNVKAYMRDVVITQTDVESDEEYKRLMGGKTTITTEEELAAYQRNRAGIDEDALARQIRVEEELGLRKRKQS